MARNRIKKYNLVSSSIKERHREIKSNDNPSIIFANNFNKFNPKVIRVS